MQQAEHSAPQLFIVDDDQSIRSFVAAVAHQAGFATKMAADVTEMHALLDAGKPSAIILDLNMGDTDGIQALNNLAARGVTAKIILFSGSDSRVLDTVKQLAGHQGLTVVAAVQKPVRRATLLEIFQSIYVETEVFSAATLRRAMTQNLLHLHYQPKVSLETYDITGCEAMLRCEDSAGRDVSPDRLVEIAEGNNLIDDLSAWVFRRAVTQCRSWMDRGYDIPVAINLAATACNPEFPALFAAICAENRVPPEKITIELTEAAVMDKELISKEMLIRLRVKGFNLSIDDFGTGYSSLLRLKQLPFSEVKVDRSFVTNVEGSRDDPAIIRAIVQLAQSLNLHSVIEGAESQHALDFAIALGCDAAQGFFISKPVEAADVETFTKTWAWRRNAMPRRGADGPEEIGQMEQVASAE